MAWYHYELGEWNRKGVPVALYTRRLFESIKPQGAFALKICTDFSGTDADDGVVNNVLDAYVGFFSMFGSVAEVKDWHGRPLPDQATAEASGKSIIIITRKE